MSFVCLTLASHWRKIVQDKVAVPKKYQDSVCHLKVKGKQRLHASSKLLYFRDGEKGEGFRGIAFTLNVLLSFGNHLHVVQRSNALQRKQPTWQITGVCNL